MGLIGRWAWALVWIGAFLLPHPAGAQSIFDFQREFRLTDFGTRSVSLSEIFTGRPRRGSFPTIDDPTFVAADEVNNIGPLEPVLSLIIDGDAETRSMTKPRFAMAATSATLSCSGERRRAWPMCRTM